MKSSNFYLQFKKSLLKDIGRVCQNVRLRNGLSIYDMAFRIGIDRTMIVKFEHGHVNSLSIYYHYYKIMNDEERNQIYEIK